MTIEVVPLTAEALALVARGRCLHEQERFVEPVEELGTASITAITCTCHRQRVKHVDFDPARLTPVALADGNWPGPEDRDD